MSATGRDALAAAAAASACFDIAVAGTKIVFPCEGGETVLEAAERAGYALPYSCRKGVCETCAGALVSGAVITARGALVRGPAEDVLLCTARPASTSQIAPTRIAPLAAPARKHLTARVFQIVRATPDVTVLRLRYPIGTRAPFRAGQYLRVLLPDGDSRNYSLANEPARNDGAELHVRHIAGGRFSEALLPRLRPGDAVEVDVPYGQCVLNADDADTPIVMIATGTGFAPMQSMILDLARRSATQQVRFYWGGRGRSDLYALTRVQAWAERLPWLTFVPVLSKPDPGWTGRTGWVHQAALDDGIDVRNCSVYACGNPAMIASAKLDFVERGGLAVDRFHCDPFVETSG